MPLPPHSLKLPSLFPFPPPPPPPPPKKKKIKGKGEGGKEGGGKPKTREKNSPGPKGIKIEFWLFQQKSALALAPTKYQAAKS